MTGRYSQWAGPLMDMGRFEWERVIKKCAFKQPSTKLLALILATYASENGSSVRPGRERLMATSGLSKGYVSAQLGRLEDLGLVFKVHNGSSYGRRGGLASVYQLTVPEDLHNWCREDPDELTQITFEASWIRFGKLLEQVHPSGHVPVQEPQEQVHSVKEHVHSDEEQVHFEAEQVHPSGPHQSLTPINNHHPKNINQAVVVALGDIRASEPVDKSDDDLIENLSVDDERNRQSAALQQRMAEYEKQQGLKAS